MADGPQAKKSKPGPPVMARVESSVLGPATDGVRDGLVDGDVGLPLPE